MRNILLLLMLQVNEEEPPDQCAAREAMEEIGYDVSERLDPEEYLEQVGWKEAE